MPSLPKILIGRNSKRNYFDMSHDVNTTADFGFCQPTLCQDLIPGSKFKLQTREFIRLAPMPVPTFARVEVKTTTRCIPLSDVFPDFKQFLTQKKLLTAESQQTYSFNRVDNVSLGHILCTLQAIQYDHFFKEFNNSYADVENLDPNNCFFRLSLWTNGEMDSQDSEGSVGSFGGYYFDIFGSDRYRNGASNTAYNQLAALFSSGVLNTEFFFGKFCIGDVFPTSLFDAIDGGNESIFRTRLAQWMTVGDFKGVSSFSQYEVETSYLGPYSQYGYFNSDGSGLPKNIANIFSKPMTLDNADFILDSGNLPEYISYNLITENGEVMQKDFNHFKIGIHLTPAGKRLFKILFAIGIDPSTKSFVLPMYKLLAYYKAWFDTYNIGRVNSWETTNAYGLIDAFHEGHKELEVMFTDLSSEDIDSHDSARYMYFYNFLRDLVHCCYVLPADQYTICNETPLYQTGDESSLTDNVLLSGTNVSTSSAHVLSVSDYHQFGKITQNDGILDALAVKALQRFYPMFNKYSVLGNKVDEILRSRYGIHLPASDFVGQDSFNCAISDIYNTSESDFAFLGEYAGKGLGSNHSDSKPAPTFDFVCGDDFYYLIQLTCVVPYGGYSQGCFDHMIKASDFYQQEFDALGMEYVAKSEIMARSFNTKYNRVSNVLFGFRPRYTKFKYHDNLANGGFAFRGEQSQFLPYMLDRHFTSPDCVSYYQDDSHNYYVRDNDAVTLAPVEELRYIGLNESYGNYDRIFIDSTGTTDNFILTMYHKFDLYAPMKSISESYDTYDKETDDTVTKTEKS